MKNIKLITAVIGLVLVVAGGVFAQIQPTAAKTEEMRRSGPCSDPWISWAHIDASAGTDAAHGVGNSTQCNPAWYANGYWANYTDLYNAVKEYRNSLARAGIRYVTKFQRDGTRVDYATIEGVMFGAISKNGRLIGLDGGTLVSDLGSGLLSDLGSGLISNAARVVPTAGGSYSLQAGEKKRVKVGPNTYLVVRK